MDTKRIEALRAEMQGKYRMESVSVGTLSCLLDALLAPAASEPAQEPEPCVFGQESDCSCSKHRCPKCSGPGSSRTLPCVDCAQEPERCECGWRYAATREEGCVPGDCSMRSNRGPAAPAPARDRCPTCGSTSRWRCAMPCADPGLAADPWHDTPARGESPCHGERPICGHPDCRECAEYCAEAVALREARGEAEPRCSYCHGVGACPRCWGRAAITEKSRELDDLRAQLDRETHRADEFEERIAREATLRGEAVRECEDLRARLAAAERARKNHAETLIGIASMDQSDGKRMRMWAKDGLSGYKEPVESTVLKLSDERNAAAQRAEAAERSLAATERNMNEHIADKHRILREYEAQAQVLRQKLAEANAYAEHEARTRRTIEKERDDAVSECGAAVVRAEAAEREIAAWERCAGIVVMAADGCDPDDRTPDALPRLVAGRITREEKRAEAAERERDDLVRQINEACAATECCSTLAEMRDTVIEGSHRLVKLERERDEARAELAENGTTLCCAYCGWIVTGITDPEQRRDAVVEHFLDCPKAPYAKMAFALQMGAICDEHIGVHQPACPICAARDRTRELTESLIQAANWQKRAEAAERRVEELTAELLNLRHTLDAALWRADRCERENLTLRVAVYQAHTATSEISRAIEAAGCSPALTAAINAVTRQRDALAAALALHREGDDRG